MQPVMNLSTGRHKPNLDILKQHEGNSLNLKGSCLLAQTKTTITKTPSIRTTQQTLTTKHSALTPDGRQLLSYNSAMKVKDKDTVLNINIAVHYELYSSKIKYLDNKY